MTIRTSITAVGHMSNLQRGGMSAIAILKGECPPAESLMPLIGQMLADKGIDRSTIFSLHQRALLAPLVGHLLMQAPPRVVQQLRGLKPSPSLPEPIYTGSHTENRLIDQAVFSEPGPDQPADGGMRATTWRGAAGAYHGGGLRVPRELRNIRILVIGGGAAGIFAARALANAGMCNVVLLEKGGVAGVGGIWGKETPKRILHAVPFPLRFEAALLEAGPRPGQEITSFLGDLVTPRQREWPAFPRVLTGEVVRVHPGDLRHTVVYLDEHGQQRELVAPVVINAIGVGEPLAPSWEGAMTTDIGPESAGFRWQEVWSEEQARRFHGRTLVFISLSNATLSMLWQIHDWNRRGMHIDYRVLSHYPEGALASPSSRIEHKGRTYRLFRDLSEFQLLRMAGDMVPFRRAFEEALDSQRILPHVTHWTLERGERRELVAVRDDGQVRRLPCDTLFTLIGYGPKADQLEAMGLSVNHRYMGSVHQAYDGEVLREPGATGRALYWPGYFCLGIRNSFNPNEVLLPGLLYRLPNLVAGTLLRAAEYVQRGVS